MVLLASSSGDGPSVIHDREFTASVALLQERLSIGLNIAKAFEQTRARSEKDEGGQIKVHHSHHSQEEERQRHDEQDDRHAHPLALLHSQGGAGDPHKRTEDSEEWSHRKLRDMVARLFRAVAAMDKRLQHNADATHRIRREVKHLARSEVSSSDLSASQHQVETRILAAAGQLKSVLSGEHMTRSIISQQEKVDDEEHSDVARKLKALAGEVGSLKTRLSSEEQAVHRLRAADAQSTLSDADKQEVMQTLAALVSAAGVQPALDAWCTKHAGCSAVSRQLITNEKLYARLGAGDAGKGDAGLEWRCYARSSLSENLMAYTGGGAYCTHKTRLLAALDSGIT